jgi:hypothetical protein
MLVEIFLKANKRKYGDRKYIVPQTECKAQKRYDMINNAMQTYLTCTNEKLKLTSKCVCAQSVNKIITVQNLNNTRIFVNEEENSI